MSISKRTKEYLKVGLADAEAAKEIVEAVESSGSSGISELTGDIVAGPGSGPQSATISNGSVTNAKAASMNTQTIKGRSTAGSGSPEDLSADQATAILSPMVGDTGSGGTKGLVPAPGPGDAANVLSGAGTWIPMGGGGSGITSVVTQVFNSSGTWTKPAGCLFVEIWVLSGGGGSGGVRSAYPWCAASGGAGAGSWTYKLFTENLLGATATVVVGAGGAGGSASTGSANNGSNGGQSSVSLATGSISATAGGPTLGVSAITGDGYSVGGNGGNTGTNIGGQWSNSGDGGTTAIMSKFAVGANTKTIMWAGRGGSTPWGGGYPSLAVEGLDTGSPADGLNAGATPPATNNGYGARGSVCAFNLSGGNNHVAGQQGSSGIVIIKSYISA